MKQGFDICGCFCLRAFCRVVSVKVMQVTLYIYLASSGAAIPKPSTVETPATPPRNERAENCNGGLQSCEAGTEKGIDVFWPRGRVRVDGAKLSKNGSAECRASDSSAPTMSSSIAKPSNEAGGKNTASYLPKIGKNELYAFIQGGLIGGTLMAYMLWVTGAAGRMKHNVQHHARPPARWWASRCKLLLGIAVTPLSLP